MLQTENLVFAYINKDEIDSLIFSHADIVYLLSGKNIQCKVLNDNYKYLTIITSMGIQEIYSLDIKRYFYNQGDKLRVLFLPETGEAFSNNENPNASFWQEKDFKRIFFGARLGYTFLTESWKQFTYPDYKWTADMTDLSIGISFVKNLFVNIGYEITTYTNYKSLNHYNIESAYTYFGFEYTFESEYLLNYLLSINYVNIRIHTENRTPFSSSLQTNGIRPGVGIFAYINRNISLNFEYAFMFSTAKAELKYPSIENRDISLNLNGHCFKAGVRFHIASNNNY